MWEVDLDVVAHCPTIAHLPRRSLRNKFISWFNLLVVNWVYPGLPGLGRITIQDLDGLQSVQIQGEGSSNQRGDSLYILTVVILNT